MASRSLRTAGAVRPFRWNVARREQLGRLLEGDKAETYRGYFGDVRTLAAKVVARASGADVVFVGRSVEGVFDYLSGIFAAGPSPVAMTLLQYSAPNELPVKLAARYPREFGALFDYFVAEKLDPASIVAGRRQVRFVDIVAGGLTFTSLYACLGYWAERQRIDWRTARRRIGFIGLTSQGKNSPNTWRWHQHKDWVSELPKANVSNISAPWGYWRLVANSEEKATPSFDLFAWNSAEAGKPSHYELHLRGLRLAVATYDRGTTAAERTRFASELAKQPEMTNAAVRKVVHSLKMGGRD